jgi:hypothetical protein
MPESGRRHAAIRPGLVQLGPGKLSPRRPQPISVGFSRVVQNERFCSRLLEPVTKPSLKIRNRLNVADAGFLDPGK